jgi:ribosomal protein S18 acetylase RimI-like enzyme
MGQICIDKAFRGQGIFDKLYAGHKEIYSQNYDCIVTEVATRNTRSLRAHQRVGFNTIHKHTDETDDWEVMVWDWS